VHVRFILLTLVARRAIVENLGVESIHETDNEKTSALGNVHTLVVELSGMDENLALSQLDGLFQ
jgi:hypothetical protein